MRHSITRPSTVLKEQAGDLLARLRLGVVDEVIITRYGRREAVILPYEDEEDEADPSVLNASARLNGV